MSSGSGVAYAQPVGTRTEDSGQALSDGVDHERQPTADQRPPTADRRRSRVRFAATIGRRARDEGLLGRAD
jgi:hypothetical protein